MCPANSPLSRQFATEKEASMASTEVSIKTRSDLELTFIRVRMVPGTRYGVSLRFLVVIRLNNSP